MVGNYVVVVSWQVNGDSTVTNMVTRCFTRARHALRTVLRQSQFIVTLVDDLSNKQLEQLMLKFKQAKTTSQILSSFTDLIDELRTRVDQIYGQEYDLNVERTTIEEQLKNLYDEKVEAQKAIQQLSKIFS